MPDFETQPACCGCGATPPPSDEDSDSSTLLSMRFGWRVIRQPDGKGGVIALWRCPSCWDRYKRSLPTKPKTTFKR